MTVNLAAGDLAGEMVITIVLPVRFRTDRGKTRGARVNEKGSSPMMVARRSFSAVHWRAQALINKATPDLALARPKEVNKPK